VREGDTKSVIKEKIWKTGHIIFDSVNYFSEFQAFGLNKMNNFDTLESFDSNSLILTTEKS
jgi:hypothetical protein